ncbi:MAG: hypothetical protein JWO92_1161 [Chitinophagaceae bacterium]|nr:hypothetical protein [Chitinophagaceae bacterium]
MKICLSFFLLIVFSQTGWAQVTWKAAVNKISDSAYDLQIKADIRKGWYVYAESAPGDGLEPVHIRFGNERILQTLPEYNSAASVITDKVFGKKVRVYKNQIAFSQHIIINAAIPATLKTFISGFASDGETFLPIEDTLMVAMGGKAPDINLKLAAVDLAKPFSACGDKQNTDRGLIAIFMLGVAGGLLALLTPCVFPMVPVTVSFFTGLGKTKKQGIKNGLLYGSSIFLIYLLASVPFHLLGNINPQIFNTISTSAGVNLFFFAIFVFFALSFFGLFNLQLPSGFANSTGSKGGIFFMALTLAIVSFSCTGPILGSLLVGSLSSEGGAWQLTAGMVGFGAALALPFALFAMFPDWLKTLPKSGGWMEVVKKSLAFVELALAVKFLSNADLVKHWGILKREIFIGLWIIIASGLALYLFSPLIRAFIKFLVRYWKTPVPVFTMAGVFKKFSKGRLVFGMIALLFALYLIPGVTKSSSANLQLLSGFPPPLSYSIYGKENINGKGVAPAVINDYDKAVQLSREQHKPILIDFTGWACVNCRKMEEQVWIKPEIAELIKNKFILVSLYVDDRKKLPADQQFIFKNKDGEKDITTVGDKWATFQAENFKQVTQPLYVILSPEGKLINNPVGYTPNVTTYKKWLECGIEVFQKQN